MRASESQVRDDAADHCQLDASRPWEGNQGAIPWVSTLALLVTPPAGGSNASGGEPPPPATASTVLQPWSDVTTETGGIASVFKWVAFNQSYNV